MPPVDRRRLDLGARGEQLAVDWYTSRGFTVLGRNWRCREGELDLVVARDRAVVFCEVKTRRGIGFGAPVEAVTAAKQQRIRGLALQWLGAHPDRRARDLRFDVASVLATRGAAPVIEVLEGVF